MAAYQTYVNTLALYCMKCGTWLVLHWLFWKKLCCDAYFFFLYS